VTQAVRHGAALVAAALFAVPLVLMASGSFRRPGAAPPTAPELVPDPASTAAYGRAFELVDLGRYALNSAVVCALTVPLAILIASWAGFAISQLPRRLATWFVVASFVALMVPATALLVPRFALFRAFGLTDTWAPLVAPGLIGVSPFYVLLYAWAFSRVPRDVLDAARADGAGVLAQWGRIAMPLVRPVTAAVAVLTFALTWATSSIRSSVVMAALRRATEPL